MKTYIINLFLLPALIAGLSLITAGRVTAQTFTTLHSFTATPGSTNSDGVAPYAGLILSGNTLYGTAELGGNSGNGTVFAVNTNGTGFTNLHSFTAGQTNSDGANPQAGLILSGDTLYGTAQEGGSSGNGTVFAINTDGTGFTNLYSFSFLTSVFSTNVISGYITNITITGYSSNSDGAYPHAGLILSGNTLYGAAYEGGSLGNGTVFAVNTNGTGFTNLHCFTYSDGAGPYASLNISGSALYGTTRFGGNSGNGTVFAVNTNGTGITNLYSFTAGSGSFPNITNSDGFYPSAGLILSGNTLYGTAPWGGSAGNGTVFAINTDGTGFTNLHSFTAGFSSFPNVTNSDGANPYAGLILSGNTLYGTAQAGGSAGVGTVFAVNTDGTRFMTLHSFTAPSGFPDYTNSDGATPYAGLILSGTTLYGTANRGGSSGNGTVFSLFIPPQLTIIRSVANVILTWPTNAAGFTLQCTTNLVSPVDWSTVSPGPVVVNGQNAVTNLVSGPQKFYRLSQ